MAYGMVGVDIYMGEGGITSSGCVYVDGIVWGGDMRKKDINRKKKRKNKAFL